MSHGTSARLRPCHMTHRLGYDMPHGTYIRSRPCHVASRQGIGLATYVKPRPCHVTNRLGLSHLTWHLNTTYDMPHGKYAKIKPFHMESMACYMAPNLTLAMPCGT